MYKGKKSKIIVVYDSVSCSVQLLSRTTTLPIAVVIIKTLFFVRPKPARLFITNKPRETYKYIIHRNAKLKGLLQKTRDERNKHTYLRLIKTNTHTLQTQTDLRDSLSELIALGRDTL